MRDAMTCSLVGYALGIAAGCEAATGRWDWAVVFCLLGLVGVIGGLRDTISATTELHTGGER